MVCRTIGDKRAKRASGWRAIAVSSQRRMLEGNTSHVPFARVLDEGRDPECGLVCGEVELGAGLQPRKRRV